MPITHIVLFGFKPTLDTKTITEHCNRMLALKDLCTHPTTQKLYIKSCVGGRNNSPEGHDHGLTHGFVVEFENEEDRKYYLESDPAHLEFVRGVGDVVNMVTVVDFVPGKF